MHREQPNYVIVLLQLIAVHDKRFAALMLLSAAIDECQLGNMSARTSLHWILAEEKMPRR